MGYVFVDFCHLELVQDLKELVKTSLEICASHLAKRIGEDRSRNLLRWEYLIWSKNFRVLLSVHSLV